MSDQYYNSNMIACERSSPKNISTGQCSKRKRFDSASTNSSCGDSLSNNNQQYDSRFEPRQIPDVQVKKSFLSSQYTNTINNNNTAMQNSNIKSSMGNSSLSNTGKGSSSITAASMSYQIILAVRMLTKDSYDEFEYKCFPEVEMTLDDDLTVQSVIREIIEKLNIKMMKDLRIRQKSKVNNCQLLNEIHNSGNSFEICEANKSGEPKGCSFDHHQVLRNIKCKSRLCLKVLDLSSIDPIIFNLLNKDLTPTSASKKLNFDVQPIQEQDDDQSIARATSHYKDSFIQKEVDFNCNSKKSSFSQQYNISSQTTTTQIGDEIASPIPKNNKVSPKNKQKKPSFWSRIFKCGEICE